MTYTVEQILHDRSTRGEALTRAEQAQLARWYAEIDRQQSQALFGQDQPPALDRNEQERLVLLREQVDELLTRLQCSP